MAVLLSLHAMLHCGAIYSASTTTPNTVSKPLGKAWIALATSFESIRFSEAVSMLSTMIQKDGTCREMSLEESQRLALLLGDFLEDFNGVGRPVKIGKSTR